MTTRGLIVSHTIEVTPNQFRLSGDVPPDSIRRYALYWDKISYPVVNGLGPNLRSCAELQILHDCDVLTLDPVEIDIGTIFSDEDLEGGTQIAGMPLHLLPHISALGQVELAKRNNANYGIWSIAQVAPSPAFGPTGTALNMAEIGLLQALPSPSVETPIEKILKFKDARTAELLGFRLAMEEMRADILASDDPERTLKLSAEVVTKRIADIERTLTEKGIAHNLKTLKVYLNPSESKVLSMAVATLIAGVTPQAMVAGLAVGMAVDTMITFGCRLVEGAERLPSDLKDYLYLYEAGIELG